MVKSVNTLNHEIGNLSGNLDRTWIAVDKWLSTVPYSFFVKFYYFTPHTGAEFIERSFYLSYNLLEKLLHLYITQVVQQPIFVPLLIHPPLISHHHNFTIAHCTSALFIGRSFIVTNYSLCIFARKFYFTIRKLK